MSQNEFEKRIKQLKNQLHTLMLARKGALQFKKVTVQAHKVPGHYVHEHTRVIYSRKAA